MAWFKVSDDWATHPKTTAAGKDARGLWFVSGTLMAKASTDGLIAKDQHSLYAALAGVPWRRNAEKLIEVRFWHRGSEVRNCRDCAVDIDNINRHRRSEDMPLLVIAPDDLYWHAWAFHQLPKHRQISPEAQAADDRDRALRKDTRLCQEIQKRDGSLCRYCGFRVNWKDRRGRHRATYDHMNPRCFSPAGGNFLEAVVTACGECNSQKGARTVAEWVADGGRTLKPAGWKAGDPDPDDLPQTWPGLDPDLIQTPGKPDSGSNPPLAGGQAHARLGPGQVGPGPGPGPEPGRVGPARLGLGGSGAGLAGLVRAAPSGAPPGATTSTRSTTDEGKNP